MRHQNNARKESSFRVRVPKDYSFEMLHRISKDIRDNLGHLELPPLPTQWAEMDKFEESLSASQLVRSRENEENSDQIAVLHFLGSFLKKFSDGSADAVCASQAEKKFQLAEQMCKSFNERGYPLLAGASCPSDYHFQQDINFARRRIREIVGDCPSKTDLFKYSRHGPGSSTQCDMKHAATYFKYRRWPYHVPPAAVDLAYDYIRTDDRWFGAIDQEMRLEADKKAWETYPDSVRKNQLLTPHQCNRVCYVPKTRKTHRTIAIESSLGVMLQLGVDGIIRRRLKRFGIDLDNQDRNRFLAREGSLSGELATLDMSMASDTVSTRLCEELLPPSWWSLLMTLRSPEGVLPDGSTVSYEKISSMGNGFTFALESLIFYALCWAVEYRYTQGYGKSKVGVFGDDLIVRSAIVPELVALLNLSGFCVNRDKSFFQGPFRESCGTDWWNGRNIRPVYLRSVPHDAPDLLIQHNMLWRWWEDVLGLPAETCSTLTAMRQWLPTSCQDIEGPICESSDRWLFSHRFDDKHGQLIVVRALSRVHRKAGPTDLWYGKLMSDLSGQAPVKEFWRERHSSGTRFVWNVSSRIRIKRAPVFVQASSSALG